VTGEFLLRPQHLRDRLGDERRLAEGGEPDPEDTGFELTDEFGRCLKCQPRLARAA